MIVTLTVVMWIGAKEERIVLIVLISNFVATGILYRAGGENWLEPQVAVLIVDIIVLAITLWVAVTSKRFWPLAIAAFQIGPVFTYMAVQVAGNPTSFAAGLTQGMWAYLQLIVLIIAAFRSQKRAAILMDKMVSGYGPSKSVH